MQVDNQQPRPINRTGCHRILLWATYRSLVVIFTIFIPLQLARSADLPKVSVGVIEVSTSIWPALVARDNGYYKQAGIDVDFLLTGGSSKTVQQVAAGAVDIGSSSTVDAFRGIDGGGGLKIFLNSQAFGTHALYGAKTIKTVADLKGKRVITGGQKDITNLWWHAMASHAGLDGEKDVDLLFAGATTNRFAALISGGVEAAALAPPYSFKAAQEGFTNLGLMAPSLGAFPMMVWEVNEQWAKSHQPEIVAFVKATNRGAQFILDIKNREAVSQMLSNDSKIGLPQALETYDLCVDVKAYVPDGAFASGALERVQTVLSNQGDLQKPLKPITAFFDGRYLAAAR